MASTYTPLGIELMATGENAGTWGTKTNANLSLIEQLTGGVNSQAVTDSGTPTALTIADGALTGTAQQRVIELTGSITGARVVTFPLLTENFYIIKNGTSGAYTVQLKAASGSGATVTFAADNKGYKLIYLDGVATNTGVFDVGFGDVTLTGTQTLTNKTLTSPKIGTNILDTGGNELINFTATGSAVNEITIANAATGVTGPVISATGETNVGININPKGSGVLNSGGSAVKIAGKETIWVPASAMYATTTNGAEAAQVETTALRPDMKVMDFADSADDHAQFTIAMPKSWNAGTITYQCYWTPSTTNTGDCIFGLQAVACADSDTIDVAFGGQGAPLVPIGDQLLFGSCKGCLNLGGIANISYNLKEKRVAGDVNFANMISNYLSNKIGHSFDKDGELAKRGKIDENLILKLEKLDFFKKEFPKSLGAEDFNFWYKPLFEECKSSINDQLYTSGTHLCRTIKNIFNFDTDDTLLITGGGAHNKFWINKIKELKIKAVIPETKLIDFKEALIFSLLGVLKLRSEINILASVTGSPKDLSAGVIHNP